MPTGGGGSDPADTQNIATFVQNLLLLQGFGTVTSWNYPSWSVGVEFYTYLLFFGMMMLIARLPYETGIVLFSVLAVGGLGLFFLDQADPTTFQNFYRSVGEFFMGALIYTVRSRGGLVPENRRLATIAELILLTSVVLSVSLIGISSGFAFAAILLFGAVVYLFSAFRGGYVHTILSGSVFRYVGKISYSIYMTHAIVIIVFYEFLARVMLWREGEISGVPRGVVTGDAWWINIMLILSVIALSSLTYRFVEIPAQRLIKRKMGGRQ